MAVHAREILLEQVHLERKAASAALTLLFRYPEDDGLIEPLAELAREELEHFQAAHRFALARGWRAARLRPGPYAERLAAAVRASEPQRQLDQLLIAALIEARSAERLFVMAQAVESIDPELSAFWSALVASEARHQAIYLDLARARFPKEIDVRLTALAEVEARALCETKGLPRLHDGPALTLAVAADTRMPPGN
jgi:tRNA-(ms[2]io[6]A)-hydroxylase